MGKLVIVRHGESEWNARGVWTGTTDVHLTAKGRADAAKMGELLGDVRFDHAFASEQVRTHETLDELLKTAAQSDVPRSYSHALDERDYGDYTGLNKWQVRDQIGEAAFEALRRSWDYPMPNGETLKDVFARTTPYFKEVIAPALATGKTIILAAHGNSIRSLVKLIEQIPDDKIADVEMIFGTCLFYDFDDSGKLTGRTERHILTELPPA
ncbi:2,3-bisphosphoglycerate-dependent phosphoglycerate mutase [Candidatus Saccharibacteria bacterium]|nr:2,3-bisphosphoglycerate-dependent phosphoglycerate mutase [Candidatus Saccharibacteria bacterium]